MCVCVVFLFVYWCGRVCVYVCGWIYEFYFFCCCCGFTCPFSCFFLSSLSALYIIDFVLLCSKSSKEIINFFFIVCLRVCVWFLFSYKILGLKAAKSFFCVYVWVWFYAWFRSFKAVEVKFWSFLVVCEFFFLLSFVGVFCYLNVVKIVTFCLSRFTCVQPNRKILSKWNGHASNSTHECVLCSFQPLFRLI